MFESKVNRGKANGYAPLDTNGKLPVNNLPPVQSIIDTGSFATTGSNTFIGNQIITGSNEFILEIHGANDNPWSFGAYNDTYSSTQAVFASWVGNNGTSYIGNEVDTPINVYTNATYQNPVLSVSSSGVTISKDVEITGSLQVTGSITLNGQPITSGGGSPYLKYVALLNQSGTDAPIATILENTLGGTPVWTRTATGFYICTLTGVFTPNKTYCNAMYGDVWGNGALSLSFGFNDIDSLILYVFNYGSGDLVVPRDFQNNPGNDMCIEVRVYP